MLLLKFYGLSRGLFFSSCLDMLFNDYFVNCGFTTHSFHHRIVLFFISCHSKRNIPGHNLPYFCRKISFSFLFLQSTIFISFLFYSYLQLISNIQCLGVSLLMCWFVVSCSCLLPPIFLACRGKKHNKKQLKRVTLSFFWPGFYPALFFYPDSSPLSGCCMYVSTVRVSGAASALRRSHS